MVQIGSMPALQRARKDARVDPEVDCEAREGTRIDRPGGVIRRMRTQSHSRDSAKRTRSEGWCRAAAAPSLLAGERGEHAEHAEACKPGEGPLACQPILREYPLTRSCKGGERFSRDLSAVANTCMHVRNRMFPTFEPATPGDSSGPPA